MTAEPLNNPASFRCSLSYNSTSYRHCSRHSSFPQFIRTKPSILHSSASPSPPPLLSSSLPLLPLPHPVTFPPLPLSLGPTKNGTLRSGSFTFVRYHSVPKRPLHMVPHALVLPAPSPSQQCVDSNPSPYLWGRRAALFLLYHLRRSTESTLTAADSCCRGVLPYSPFLSALPVEKKDSIVSPVPSVTVHSYRSRFMLQ